jgi:2-hydroxychromene-2-carboxylate isomerase
MKTFEFWFDFGSPASYLAWTQIAEASSPPQGRAPSAHRPMLLGGVFQATGNHSPATIPAKGATPSSTSTVSRGAMACR